MNEEEESHWFSGTPQEPMRMKGLEGGEKPPPPQKRLWLDYYCICYVKIEWGAVNLREGCYYFFFFGLFF